MFTWSFGWTSSPARFAITSLAFMFEEVPEPVWKTSIGNWSSCSPAATASPAAAIRSAIVGVEQAELGVDPRRGGLDPAQPVDHRRRDRLPGDGEVLDRLVRSPPPRARSATVGRPSFLRSRFLDVEAIAAAQPSLPGSVALPVGAARRPRPASRRRACSGRRPRAGARGPRGSRRVSEAPCVNRADQVAEPHASRAPPGSRRARRLSSVAASTTVCADVGQVARAPGATRGSR